MLIMEDSYLVPLCVKHIKKAIGYLSPANCPFALAVKELVGTDDVREIVDSVRIEGKLYIHKIYSYANYKEDVETVQKNPTYPDSFVLREIHLKKEDNL